jgi:enolase
MIIKEVGARAVKDSRGENTIEVSVNSIKASSPSGKSTGIYETKPYRKSLKWNVNFFNKTKEFDNLEINSFGDLKKVEKLLKKKLKLKNVKEFGANALFAFESAVLKSLAKDKGIELWQVINSKAKKFPTPVGNAVGGGLHSSNKNKPEFQEFLLIPKEKSFSKNVKVMNRIYSKLKTKLKNDEGAWQTSLSNEEVFETLSKFKNIRFGTDVAASSFYKKGKYCYKENKFDKKGQINYVNDLIKKYNLFYVEDALEEEDFSGFSKVKSKNLVVGDDLTATQINRLKKAIRKKSVNAMIIKPNQNGSLLEVKKVFELCKRNKIKTILSHRSGETMDDALSDYAFGFGADYIKCGISTKWREAKLKRMIEIEKSF